MNHCINAHNKSPLRLSPCFDFTGSPRPPRPSEMNHLRAMPTSCRLITGRLTRKKTPFQRRYFVIIDVRGVVILGNFNTYISGNERRTYETVGMSRSLVGISHSTVAIGQFIKTGARWGINRSSAYNIAN
jgi:hypothetical protein